MTTAISFRRLSTSFESMVSSALLDVGAGLVVRNLLSVAERTFVMDGGVGRNDCTRKLKA